MIPVDLTTHQLIRRIVRSMPFAFFGPMHTPTLRDAFETGVDGVVLVFIDYGSVALRGIMVIQEPELQLYLDYHSIMQIIQVMIENALTEYDSSKDVQTDE